tara:strand:+ start:1654 stop:1872 length:219 start_codon:yes stop_codon:yes gene_type:complete
MVDFMKTKLNTNLVESELELDQETATKVTGIVDLSISQAFSLAYGSVDSALTAFENDIKKSSTKSSKKSTKK